MKEFMVVMDEDTLPPLVSWPTYEDGAPVLLGDATEDSDEVCRISFTKRGFYFDSSHRKGLKRYRYGEPVKRAVPAADGKPLHAGQTVWHEDGTELRVLGFKHEEDGERIVSVEYVDGPTNWSEVRSLSLTHTNPEPKKTCKDCRYWHKDTSANAMGVCFDSYAERDCVDSYEARLDDAEVCSRFRGRYE